INIEGIEENKRQDIIGFLPQHFYPYKELSCLENLLHYSYLKGLKHDKQYAEEVLSQVNLLKHSNTKVSKLSGGMIRRLGIAQAILGSPKILIVDEPTTGLDIAERVRFRTL
ncbi:ATP-binding cassette domain-containing protein, partial [Streptomyces californicus]|uniref:ATP-binding cassette domain-containing protein n=1 Tax=Streptomyces californicus TaxID=67351 RepID=UPI00364A383B